MLFTLTSNGMDLHPLVIHFPIAFLTIYAVFELIRFRRVIDEPHWLYVKKVLIIIGWAGSIVAALTGLNAANWTVQGQRIFVMHEIFAITTIALSTISTIFYLKNKQHKILVLIAVLILITITITGGLGGAMTRGTHFDPLMAPIFKLLNVY